MDKPVPFWFVFLTIVILISVSYIIYKWLENLKEFK
ncbi:glutamyl-tRNA amidotransferase [Lebetimonas natsushimae]|nr:glutamyl-tRNA amidotransferase [Lebetimonas natsushimae]